MKTLYLLLFPLLLLFACSDSLDIKQDYDYTLKTLPYPKALKNGETAPLEFTIIRDGNYTETRYYFRYFQSDGKGTLTDDKGMSYAVNRFYPLWGDAFKLLYRSECANTQTLDFVFKDNFGKEVEYKISFQNNSED